MSIEKKIRISAAVTTSNDSKHLAKCLDSLKQVADEIIVLDSSSAESIHALAKQYKARYVSFPRKSCSDQKSRTAEYATHNYILSLNSDERLSKSLRKSILEIKNDNTHYAYSFGRKTFMGNQRITHAEWNPAIKPRLWHKNPGQGNSKAAHEATVFNGQVSIKHLKGNLLHQSFANAGEHLITLRKHARLSVEEKHKKNKKSRLFPATIYALINFLATYILKLGMLNGKTGFVISLNSGLRYLIEYFLHKKKLNEIKKGQGVCFVNTTKTWGGGEKWHFESAEYLSRENHDIYFVAAGKSALIHKLKDTHITTCTVDISNLSFINPFKIYKLYRFFKHRQIKAVIFNGSSDLKTGGLAAFMAGVPNILYRRGLAVAPKRSYFNIFLFTTVTDYFIVNSESTLKELVRNVHLNPDTLKIKLLYNGVPGNEKIDSVSAGQKVKDNLPVTLGNASRLVDQKGLSYLIETAGELKKRNIPFRVKIAGTGPLEKSLKTLAKQCHVEKEVEFPGFVHDIKQFMREIDIYLCTSKFEGFGFSIAEAMLAQKPVVGFDVSSNPELIQHGKTGFIVAPFDVSAFTEKVISLIQDNSLRESFGTEGQKYAKDQFLKEKQNKKLESFLYEELTGNVRK